MKNRFTDIIERAGQPDWYDENGTPRYGKFTPQIASSGYHDYACFFEIACQCCGKRYKVSVTLSKRGLQMRRMEIDKYKNPNQKPYTKKQWKEMGIPKLPLPDSIGSFHYGDPPHQCPPENCLAGYSENSIPIRVIEMWMRGSDFKWRRMREH